MAQKDFLSSKIEDAAFIASNSENAVFTDFYEPSLQHIIEREIGRYPQSDCEFFGGHEFCERKMLCVYPKGAEIKGSDFPIDCVKISSAGKDIAHPDVLGSVIGLGLERDKIGDINITEQLIQIFVSSPLGEFIEQELRKIGRHDVEAKCVPLREALCVEPAFNVLSVIIPSMRLDAVVHTVFRLSRSEAAAFIKSEKVFINHVPAGKPSVNIKPNDIISVRSKGKFIVDEITGNTKKGNIKLTVKKFA